jgi:hypothetical protein
VVVVGDHLDRRFSADQIVINSKTFPTSKEHQMLKFDAKEEMRLDGLSNFLSIPDHSEKEERHEYWQRCDRELDFQQSRKGGRSWKEKR